MLRLLTTGVCDPGRTTYDLPGRQHSGVRVFGFLSQALSAVSTLYHMWQGKGHRDVWSAFHYPRNNSPVYWWSTKQVTSLWSDQLGGTGHKVAVI